MAEQALKKTVSQASFWGLLALAGLTLLPFFTSAMALVLGIIVGLIWAKPYHGLFHKWIPNLLMISIVGMGGGMDFREVLAVGINGVTYTVIGIVLTFLLGLYLNRFFGINHVESLLIISGTAICGGSAIAAVASSIRAQASETSVALITIFLLNSLALLIFPVIGHWLNMDPSAFGLWSALAIHDTSSVMGAAASFGTHALTVAATVKLARTLWIVPIAFGLGLWWQGEDEMGSPKARRPWFILGFLAMAALSTHVEDVRPLLLEVSNFSRRLLVMTLFFVGATLDRNKLKGDALTAVGFGATLWAIVASVTLVCIRLGWIRV